MGNNKVFWLVSLGIIIGFIFIGTRGYRNKVVAQAPAECSKDDTANWCQVAHDAQHSGFTPATLGTNFQVAWTHPFQPDRVYPQVQAIVYRNKVYVGTEGANGQVASVYALNSANGQQVWKHEIGYPIMSSVGANNGVIYVSAMDGAVYALNADNGNQIWKTQINQTPLRTGFSASPVIGNNRIFLGNRNGIFYALNFDGSIAWQTDLKTPILQTAAVASDRVVVGGLNMVVYVMDANNGSVSWKSSELRGMAFKDYWPVIVNNEVFIRPIIRDTIWESGFPQGALGSPFTGIWGGDTWWTWLSQNGSTIAQGHLNQLAEAMSIQDNAMASYQANPQNFQRLIYNFNLTTGQETSAFPHFVAQTMNGTTTPGCIDRDNLMVMPVEFFRSGWGRWNLTTRRLVDVLFDNYAYYDQPLTANSHPAGFGNTDENLNVTCTQNLILSMHTQEGNANYTGAFNLDTRRWKLIDARQSSQQMSTNTQGGNGNPASVAGTTIYHITWHELIARTTN